MIFSAFFINVLSLCKDFEDINFVKKMRIEFDENINDFHWAAEITVEFPMKLMMPFRSKNCEHASIKTSQKDIRSVNFFHPSPKWNNEASFSKWRGKNKIRFDSTHTNDNDSPLFKKVTKWEKRISDRHTLPKGSCNPRSGLEMRRFKMRYFEKPRFPCSELQKLD